MKNLWNKHILLIFTLLTLSILLIVFSQNFCFFYDNTSQISIPAHWFYNNGISNIFVPAEIATGHPTLMPIYIALIWKTFGYSVSSAHWAMLPFIFGFLWQLYLLLQNFFLKKSHTIAAMVLVITDACILSQSTLITFEIPHIFFFLLALNAILRQKRILLSISFILICLISLRGTLSGFGLLVFDFLYNRITYNKWDLKRIIVYTPGLLLITAYLAIRYFSSGWAIHNTTSKAWEISSQFAPPSVMLKNLVILALRLIEYGRIFIIIVLFFIIIRFKQLITDKKFNIILITTITQALFLFPVVIIYQNPFSTRYFMPIIIMLIVLAVYFILYYTKYKIVLYLFLVLNIGGYFIVYPQQIAMPWDCTPAHWPYYELRENMLNYITNQNIDIKEVSGGYSFYGNQKYKDLKRNYSISQEPIKKYYIHTNISNPSDSLIFMLTNSKSRELVIRFEKRNVFIELYQFNTYKP